MSKRKKSNKDIILEEAKKAGLSGTKLDQFIAQIHAETGGWNNPVESAVYRPSTVKKKFKKTIEQKGLTDKDIEKMTVLNDKGERVKFGKKAQEAQKLLFNTLYGDKLGNKGEGYKYRGRGPIQITGKENYEKYGVDPDKMQDIRYAASASAKYFADKVKDIPEDADVDEFTRAVNPGTDKADFKKRKDIYNKLIEKKETNIEQSRGPAMAKQDIVEETDDITKKSREELEAEILALQKENEGYFQQSAEEEPVETDLSAMSSADIEAELAKAYKMREELQDITWIDTALVKGANAAVMNFGDEILAGMESAFTSKTYEEALKENREVLRKAELANPSTAFISEMAGGMAGGFGLGKMVKAGKYIAGAKKDIVMGGVEGSIDSLGRSEEQELLNQLSDTLSGGGIGLGAGAFGSAIGKGFKALKKESQQSGEELIDRSMGIYNKSMKKQLRTLLDRKGISKDEFYNDILNIKLEDGTPVFSPKKTRQEVIDLLNVKMGEFEDGFQQFYNVKSQDIGPVINPVKAIEDMKLRLSFDNDAFLEGLKNPKLKQFWDAQEALGVYNRMFATPDAVTPGEFWSNIRALETHFKSVSGAKSYYQLDEMSQRVLDNARDYLENTMRAHLSPEDFSSWQLLKKQFNYSKQYGKIVQNAADEESAGIIAGLMKTLSNSNMGPVLGGVSGAGDQISGNFDKVMAGMSLGFTLKTYAKSPKVNKTMGEVLTKVGNFLEKGEALDEPMKRLVNASVRSLADFEKELQHEAIRIDGGLPTVEEQEAEVEKIKASGFGVRDTVKFINQARSGVRPNYQVEQSPPFIKQTQPVSRDVNGKKKSLDERQEEIVITPEGPIQLPEFLR